MTKKKPVKAMAGKEIEKTLDYYRLMGVRAVDARRTHEAQYWLNKLMELSVYRLRMDLEKMPKKKRDKFLEVSKPKSFWSFLKFS